MTHSVIDEAPYTGFHRKMLLQSAGGPFLDGYILTIIGVVLAAISTELDLSGTETGLVGAAALIGLFLGGFGFGRLTDIIGRKPPYLIGILLTATWGFFAFPLYDTGNGLMIFIGILAGLLFHGLMYAPQPAIMSEMFPTRMRYSGVSIGYQVTAIVAGLHPHGLSLRETVGLYALANDLDEEELLDSAVPAIVDLVRHGLVLPAEVIL